ncbi:group III truncated hemoglobin [Actinoplanes sp. TRM 88003]|uniref:Group III truncated hemoglobin n=1 Tax=Paractinoplanes aksuensis TaxID=2939490 RepID=A0ABT1DVN3_9ACTN|nr:group III truncated hemoglobin [Actinoplanes aksuensis]MCO8274116.1 group III truncated hemoglobin [Actinoplanes aksuensis]
MAQDLAGRPDVQELVGAFYRQAFADPLIGPIFTDIARMDLEAHMPIMCDFWETALFRTGSYKRNALQLHFALDNKFQLEPQHFARWVELWGRAVDERFAGPKAELAKRQAERIAGAMHRRLSQRRLQWPAA